MKRFFLVACAFIVAMLTCGGVWAQSEHKKIVDPVAKGISAITYRGGIVSPPLPKGKFTLTDTSGLPFDFSSRRRDTSRCFFSDIPVVQIYALCTWPISRRHLDARPIVSRKGKSCFVTTDPERDSPQVIRTWLDHFDKRFIGLTGTEAAIEAAERASVVPVAKKSALANGDYQVGHASFVLAYTRDNLAHVIYPGGVTQKDWTQDLPRLVKETWSSP